MAAHGEPPSKAHRGDGHADVSKVKDSSSEEGRRQPRSTCRGVKGPSDSLPSLTYKDNEPLDFPKYFNPKSGQGKAVKVIIPGEALSNTNRQVQGRQLWGSDIYTHDSDLVAVLVHLGYYSHVLSAPPPGVTEAQVVIVTLPVQEQYPSKCRNNIRSRTWCGHLEGCSIKVEGCWLVNANGLTELQPTPEDVPALAPSFMPAAMERIMHTRSSSASGDRRHRMKQEVSIQYNLCNEPWLKYTMGAIADQGLQPSQWTSARLHTEVLYLETHRTRYEVSRRDQGEVAEAENGSEHRDKYRWARCLEPQPLSYMRKAGVPLPEKHIEVLEPALEWEDFQWSPNGLYIEGKHYPIVRLHFIRISNYDKENGK